MLPAAAARRGNRPSPRDWVRIGSDSGGRRLVKIADAAIVVRVAPRTLCVHVRRIAMVRRRRMLRSIRCRRTRMSIGTPVVKRVVLVLWRCDADGGRLSYLQFFPIAVAAAAVRHVRVGPLFLWRRLL